MTTLCKFECSVVAKAIRVALGLHKRNLKPLQIGSTVLVKVDEYQANNIQIDYLVGRTHITDWDKENYYED